MPSGQETRLIFAAELTAARATRATESLKTIVAEEDLSQRRNRRRTDEGRMRNSSRFLYLLEEIWNLKPSTPNEIRKVESSRIVHGSISVGLPPALSSAVLFQLPIDGRW